MPRIPGQGHGVAANLDSAEPGAIFRRAAAILATHSRTFISMRLPILAAATLAAAVVGIGTADAAKRKVQVPHRFDGRWSIEVVTLDGPCDRAYRYGVQIQRGEAVYGGGDFDNSGRVAANGSVRGTISRDGNAAQVLGRLTPQGTGSGRWSTVGDSLIQCSGSWNATRRG